MTPASPGRSVQEPFRVVPVIDLLDGQVVRALRGQRDRYRPIDSPLTGSSNPVAVVDALLVLHPFERFYIADLDAIQRIRPHGNLAIITTLIDRHPQIRWWVDAGFDSPATIDGWRRRGLDPVIGTESMSGCEQWNAIRDAVPGITLSLDRRGGQPLGPPALFDDPSRWPDDAIVMTLDRVGSHGGPAWDDIASAMGSSRRTTQARTQGKAPRIWSAGGTRDAADLEALARRGVAGALVASALHDGSIDGAAVRAVERSAARSASVP